MSSLRQPQQLPAKVVTCLLGGLLLWTTSQHAVRAQEPPEPVLEAEPAAAQSNAPEPQTAVKTQPAETPQATGEKPSGPADKPAAPMAAAEAEDAESDGTEAGAPSPTEPEKIVRVSIVRPAMDAAQRKDWADRLRLIYSQEPARWPRPTVDASVKWTELGILPEVEHPADNPHSPEKAKLGELLFFDPRLSGSGQMACASCHDPDLAWADGRRTAIGNKRKQLGRNTPSILTAGYGSKYFWDGRAESLEDQAAQVLYNADEMASSAEHVVEQVSAAQAYRDQFKTAFGDDTITLERVCQAIACFERTLARSRSRFDFFVRGNYEVLSDEALIGLHLFRTDAKCMNCHHGPNFSDNEFHDLGLSYYGRKFEDLGRHNQTAEPRDVGRFKTPTLRNVANTGPYMHNGLFPLQGVLNLYNAGMPTLRRKPNQMEDPFFPTKSPLLEPLSLNRQDLDALKAFLESLSEPTRRLHLPVLPEADAAAQP